MSELTVAPVHDNPAVRTAKERLDAAKRRHGQAEAAYQAATRDREKTLVAAAIASQGSDAIPEIPDPSRLKTEADVRKKAVELLQEEYDRALDGARAELKDAAEAELKKLAPEAVARWRDFKAALVKSMEIAGRYGNAGSLHVDNLVPPLLGIGVSPPGSKSVDFEMLDTHWLGDLKRRGLI